MASPEKTTVERLRQIHPTEITPGVYDLLERINSPWIRLAHDDDGKVVVDKASGAPMLAGDLPTMSEVGTTLIVFLNLGNPTVLQWITDSKIEQVANRFLQTITRNELIEAQIEIKRILQINET